MSALAERTRLVREWTSFLSRTPLVLAPVCTEPPYAHGFDVESTERTLQVWRECATLMAVPVLGLPAIVGADRRSGGAADRRAARRSALSRGPGAWRAAEAIEARAPRLTPIDPRP